MPRTWNKTQILILKEYYQVAPRNWLEEKIGKPWSHIVHQAYHLKTGPRLIREPDSEETKRRKSEATKGRPKTIEHRQNIARGKTGKKASEAHKRAMSETRKAMGLQTWLGRHHTEESKAKISAAKRHHPIDAETFRANNSTWRAIAEQVRTRDNHRCLICGEEPKKQAHPVHHIIPYRLVREHNPNNLITLCRCCHFHIEVWGLWDYCCDIMELKHGIDPRKVSYFHEDVWGHVIAGNV